MIDFWVSMVKNGMSIDKVPAKWRELVRERIENG